MKRHNDSYYTNLLNSEDFDVFDGYMSQPSSVLEFQRAQDHERNASLVESQHGSSNGNMQKRVRKLNFTVQEDLILVSTWLNVSMDPITGIDKKYQTYWERVHVYFEEHRQFTSDRNVNSLMHRWSTIQLVVSKFQGYMSQIESLNQSGATEQDKICQALEMFKSLQSTPFAFIHCWKELHHALKFVAAISKKKSKGKSSQNPNSTSSSPTTLELDDSDTLNNENSNGRPLGRKVTKEYARKSKNARGENDTILILVEIRESQKQQRDERKALAAKFLKIETDRVEREKKKKEREQVLHEQKILAIDTSNMDERETEYYTSLKETIIERRRKIGFNL